MGYKNEKCLSDRKTESNTMLTRFPERIPVIVERKNEQILKIDKRKFMTPKLLTMGQFIFIIRKRMKLSSEQAIFIFTKNKLINQNTTIRDVYQEDCDEDGFLYLYYDFENTFG